VGTFLRHSVESARLKSAELTDNGVQLFRRHFFYSSDPYDMTLTLKSRDHTTAG